jgi:hypothetical protein
MSKSIKSFFNNLQTNNNTMEENIKKDITNGGIEQQVQERLEKAAEETIRRVNENAKSETPEINEGVEVSDGVEKVDENSTETIETVESETQEEEKTVEVVNDEAEQEEKSNEELEAMKKEL